MTILVPPWFIIDSLLILVNLNVAKIPRYNSFNAHFTVVCSETWPLNDREVRGDLALIQTSLLLSCKHT